MSAATWLLILTALVYVASAAIVIANSGAYADVYREAYEGTSADSMAESGGVSTIIGGVVSLLIAAGLVVLAILDYRGKNPARIVTWVLGGIGLCCGGAGLALGSLLTNMQVSSDADVPTASELQQMLEDALPSWYFPLTTTLTVVTILALAGALLLLALPPSNEFFRKPKQPFEPPPPAYPQVG